MKINFPKSCPIIFTTASDFPTAQIAVEAGVDAILVGDSLGTTVLGYSDIRMVTVADMLHHTRAVLRGAGEAPVIIDLPYRSYITPKQTLANVKKFIKIGVAGVKVEGGIEIIKIVEELVKNKIWVMGHLGLTPQTAEKFCVTGRDEKEAQKILANACALEKAGLKALVLECVPVLLAKKITAKLKIPTIGIGAGKYCDGQILVFHDLVGLTASKFQPKFLKRYGNVRDEMLKAVKNFVLETREKKFPDEKHSYN